MGILMPTNLPPEALAKQKKYQEAKTLREKLIALEEFIAAIPKHKGTENLLKELKRKRAQLRRMLREEQERRRSSKATSTFFIKKEGAGQIALIGLPSSGKSTLLRVLTGNTIDQKLDASSGKMIPIPGITFYEDVPIQVVEVPSIFEGIYECSIGPQIMALIRNADAIALVIDLTQDVRYQITTILEELNKAGIKMNKTPPPVTIQRTSTGGITIIGEKYMQGFSPSDVIEVLKEMKIYNAIVKIYGNITYEDFLEVLHKNTYYKKAIIIANKGDAPNTLKSYKALVTMCKDSFKIIPASAKLKKGTDEIKKTFFEILDIMRIYTKDPNEGVSKEPIILKRGSKVLDLAERIHSTFVKNFKYAKVWRKEDGESVKVLKVGLDFELKDGDVVRIYV